MDVGGMPFHLLEDKFDFGLRDHLLLIDSDNTRPLLEFAGTAAPARPDTETHVVDWQRWRRDNIYHADKCLHAIELATDIFAKHAALQVGKHG
jgi:hypothetical protein